MRLWKQAAVSLAVLVVAAIAWAYYFPGAAALMQRAGLPVPAPEQASTDGPSAAGGPGGRRAPTPRVIGAPVVEAKINDAVSAIGDGRALRSVIVTPYVAGRVVGIAVRPGDYVAAGAPLVRLDQEGEEIAVDRARLNLEDALATRARAEELAEARAVSEVARREAALAASQAELELRDAELALEHRVIRAPFDGFVGILGVDIGDQVSAATEVATLDDRSRILVDFRVPERFVGQMAIGNLVSARPLARPSLQLDGEVTAIDTRIDADTRTLRVQASLDNDEDLLRAGMAFSMALRFPGDSFPAVDPLAIQWSANGAYVWAADADGKAARVPIRIVQRNNDFVLVDAALTPGDLVVTEGSQLLRPGMAFEYDNAPAPAAGGDRTPTAGIAPPLTPAGAPRVPTGARDL